MKLGTRQLHLALLTVAITVLSSAEAQQPAKIPRIGYLAAAPLSVITHRTEPFRQGLRELGYVEDKNIVIEWRSSERKRELMPALAAELVRLKVDVVVSAGAGATRGMPAENRLWPIARLRAHRARWGGGALSATCPPHHHSSGGIGDPRAALRAFARRRSEVARTACGIPHPDVAVGRSERWSELSKLLSHPKSFPVESLQPGQFAVSAMVIHLAGGASVPLASSGRRLNSPAPNR